MLVPYVLFICENYALTIISFHSLHETLHNGRFVYGCELQPGQMDKHSKGKCEGMKGSSQWIFT